MQFLSKKDKSKNAPEKSSRISDWFSTYGRLTVERLFENFKLSIHIEDLLIALKNQHSFYYKVLVLPFEHISNGLILDQVHEYQVYTQKLLIDYLLSGQNDAEEDSPGENVRESLEEERNTMMSLSETFLNQKKEHKLLIAKTQGKLIKVTKKFMETLKDRMNDDFFIYNQLDMNTSNRIINLLLAHQNETNQIDEKGWDAVQNITDIKLTEEIKTRLMSIIEPLFKFHQRIENINAEYQDKTLECGTCFRRLRTDFYELILRTNELLQYLPSFPYNDEQGEKNRESLDFDRKILE